MIWSLQFAFFFFLQSFSSHYSEVCNLVNVKFNVNVTRQFNNKLWVAEARGATFHCAGACFCARSHRLLCFYQQGDYRGPTVTELANWTTRDCQTMADEQEIMCKLENILEIR